MYKAASKLENWWGRLCKMSWVCQREASWGLQQDVLETEQNRQIETVIPWRVDNAKECWSACLHGTCTGMSTQAHVVCTARTC